MSASPILASIQACFEKAVDPDLPTMTIDAAVAPLVSLRMAAVIEVARGMGILLTLRTKRAAIAAIRRRIENRKENAGLIDFGPGR